MSFSEQVDSVASFVGALQKLEEEYSGNDQIVDVLKSIQACSSFLTRRSRVDWMQQLMAHVESVVVLLDNLGKSNQTLQTGRLSVSAIGSIEREGRFQSLLNGLSVSIPTVFHVHASDRERAVGETKNALHEVELLAQDGGNPHVVNLCRAMGDVVAFHYSSKEQNTYLLKPLLRGFALLRTAIESPEEPHLSPALIDSTANLIDLVGAKRLLDSISQVGLDDPTISDSDDVSIEVKDQIEGGIPQREMRRENLKTVSFEDLNLKEYLEGRLGEGQEKQEKQEELDEEGAAGEEEL